LFFLLPSLIYSQQETPTGNVTGNVYCTDTNLPARFARVELSSVPSQRVSTSKPDPNAFRFFTTQTRADGSFAISHVPTGEFFVSVAYAGYLRPEWKFDHATLRQPTPEQRVQLLKAIPNVTVAAGKSVTIEVPLQRGGTISGAIVFEDGAPFVHATITALSRDSKGQWSTLGGPYTTDDLGKFRISSVPPGEYTLAAETAVQDSFGKWSGDTRKVYYGDAFFESEAKSFKLTEAEDTSGIDITIHLSKLHFITGSLTDPGGQIINAGEITLLTIPDKIEVSKTQVGADDSTFHLDFVPEGHYLLRVINPRNVSRKTILPPTGFAPIPVTKETDLQTFKSYEAPIDVLTDLPNLNIPIAATTPGNKQ
jgi:hypothetical protein